MRAATRRAGFTRVARSGRSRCHSRCHGRCRSNSGAARVLVDDAEAPPPSERRRCSFAFPSSTLLLLLRTPEEAAAAEAFAPLASLSPSLASLAERPSVATASIASASIASASIASASIASALAASSSSSSSSLEEAKAAAGETAKAKAIATTTTTTTRTAATDELGLPTGARQAESGPEALAEALAEAETPRSRPANRGNSGSHHRGLFPWRSSPRIPDRLVPGTEEHRTRGMLLGGNLTSSHPSLDAMATMRFFLGIPLADVLFFRKATEADLAEDLAWAFGKAVEELAQAQTQAEVQVQGARSADKHTDTDKHTHTDKNTDKHTDTTTTLRTMMEPTKLASLFEAAREFGRESLEVKLEVRPILSGRPEGRGGTRAASGPEIASLFVFPFLSRSMLAGGRNKGHLRKYSRLLDALTGTGAGRGGTKENESESENENENDRGGPHGSPAELSEELLEDFRERGECENTIVCQVLVPCLETFWVRDRATGEILQRTEESENENENENENETGAGGSWGGGDRETETDPETETQIETDARDVPPATEPKLVYHLVRFERVAKTKIVRGSRRLFPFEQELGEWTITDIDDLCDGNQLF